MEFVVALLMAILAIHLAAWAVVMTMIGMVRFGLWLTLQFYSIKRKFIK